MENDSIRTNGEHTVVELWLQGRMRAVTIPRITIEGYLQRGRQHGGAMSEDDRTEFVRTNLKLVVDAALTRLKVDGQAAAIVIGPGQLRPS